VAGGAAPRTSDNPTHETNMNDSQPDDLKDTHSRDELPTGKCPLTPDERLPEAIACADGRLAFRGSETGEIIWTQEAADLGAMR